MFISIIGPDCSGKKTTMQYLIQKLSFQALALGHRQSFMPEDTMVFSHVTEMLRYVTQNWRSHFVACDIDRLQDLTVLRKRPFFLLVAIDAPVSLRYQRLKIRHTGEADTLPTLEDFVAHHDQERFHSWTPAIKPQAVAKALATTTVTTMPDKTTPPPPQPLLTPVTTPQPTPFYKVLSTADLYIVNSYSTPAAYFQYLDDLNLLNPERLRPSWDTYFMMLSELASRRSNCMKRRVGCILVKDNRVIATGYNGSPRGIRNCADGGCPRCNAATPCGESLHHCLCLHAEENALLEAGRVRVEGYGRCILYCNTCPCLGCAKKIVQVGVQEVVYSQAYGMDKLSAQVFAEAGVVLRQHFPPLLKMDIEGDFYVF
ncbi:Deoxycytidine monophosphate (dCMP) deaminase [Dimargaris cristalligena]|nr:Deoxycytidine monophosphate (dCMP) deaminase [Dimargaris cristalligena]